MKFFLLVTLLAAASASPLSVNQQSRCEDSELHRTNITTSPFVNIMDVRIDTPEPVYSTPAVLLVGTNKEVWRCKAEDPNVCEVLYKAAGYAVYSLHITGEQVYAGTSTGTVYQCKLNKIDSCDTFLKGDLHNYVMALASEKGYLYAGLNTGTILRCRLNEPNSCRPLHALGSQVSSLKSFNGSLYAGLYNGRLMNCSLETENSCTLLYTMNTTISIESLYIVNNSWFAATRDGFIWNCMRKSESATDFCTYVSTTHDKLWGAAYFNDILYKLIPRYSSSFGIATCKGVNNTECTKYENIDNAFSVALAYATYYMQHRYTGEDKNCKNNQFVTYYNETGRAQFEVHIKNNKLYNAFGVLVDTSNADRGSSGPAAIFAMGPDGKIFLSNKHQTGLLHTSSFFAGNPVSGAGEMVVERGMIKKIISCSDHYQPDLTLNRQVLQSLRAQGYTDPIISVKCGEDGQGEEEFGQTEPIIDP